MIDILTIIEVYMKLKTWRLHVREWREIMTNPIVPIQYPAWLSRHREQQNRPEGFNRLNNQPVDRRFETIFKRFMTDAAHH